MKNEIIPTFDKNRIIRPGLTRRGFLRRAGVATLGTALSLNAFKPKAGAEEVSSSGLKSELYSESASLTHEFMAQDEAMAWDAANQMVETLRLDASLNLTLLPGYLQTYCEVWEAAPPPVEHRRVVAGPYLVSSEVVDNPETGSSQLRVEFSYTVTNYFLSDDGVIFQAS